MQTKGDFELFVCVSYINLGSLDFRLLFKNLGFILIPESCVLLNKKRRLIA